MDESFTDTVPQLPKASIEQDIGDTDELPALALRDKQELSKYARSFVRFYRARRILSGNRNLTTVTRERALEAWKYLDSLTPDELPLSLRTPYRELFALAYLLQRRDESQSPVEFVSKIFTIAISIDEIVDRSLSDTKRRPS